MAGLNQLVELDDVEEAGHLHLFVQQMTKCLEFVTISAANVEKKEEYAHRQRGEHQHVLGHSTSRMWAIVDLLIPNVRIEGVQKSFFALRHHCFAFRTEAKIWNDEHFECIHTATAT